MPGATANGTFATNPITSVPITVANMVATNTPPQFMPAPAKILGFTNMIYAIVKKVVTPARISVRKLEPLLVIPKNLSIQIPPKRFRYLMYNGRSTYLVWSSSCAF
jgi:hypothetical protein